MSEEGANRSISSVIVVGGGLAGLACACALAEAGYQVRLLERRPYLGGRASSYRHPGTGEVIDNCQHVLLGNCANLIDFYRRLKVSDRIRWFDQMTFLEPGGRRSVIRASSLPAPFHSFPSFCRAHALTMADKFAIASALAAMLRGGSPDEAGETMAAWLGRHRQTRRAISRFWRPILVSALNEELERMSPFHARQVIRLSLLFSAEGGRIGIPSVPLSELYGSAGRYLQERGGTVHLREPADKFSWDREDRSWTVGAADHAYTADAVVLAVPYEAMVRLLPALPPNPAADRLAEDLRHWEHSPITGIHLWFDRQITDLDHAVLLDRTIQWMFHKSRLQPEIRKSGAGSYVELVVSASRSLVPMERRKIIELAVSELEDFFPLVGKAALRKAAVVKEVRATYSIFPGLSRYRARSESPWPRVFLAGDWTWTGWPATMEGAVRSGYLSAAALTKEAGCARDFLVPELPRAGWMRWMAWMR